MTNTERLATIDAAIDGILSGNQSYSVLGRTFTKANLRDLWAMRKEVAGAIAAEGVGGDVRVKLAVLPP